MGRIKALFSLALACLMMPFALAASVLAYLACLALACVCFVSVLEMLLELYAWGELHGGLPSMWKALGFAGWAAASFAVIPLCVAAKDVMVHWDQSGSEDYS